MPAQGCVAAAGSHITVFRNLGYEGGAVKSKGHLPDGPERGVSKRKGERQVLHIPLIVPQQQQRPGNASQDCVS